MRRSLSILVVVVLVLFVAIAEARRRSVREGVDVTTLPTAQWLQKFAIPFATVEPRTGFGDLEGLRHVVRDARIVSLGESTHGTREFFKMKHRILEYLVETMGFTIFAIEAALAESDAVNDYVLHGIGDPRKALSGLYFWTWNTQEVLDMIEWMRAYNLRRGDRPPVQFRGFDVQASVAAIQRLEAYLDRVDPAGKSQVASLWSCWAPHARGITNYGRLPSSEKNACAASLQQLYALLESRRADYSARSSAAEFEVNLRYARVMIQNEAVFAPRTATRDAFMAENVEWLANVAQPGEKLVLWAHNGHVAFLNNRQMGWYLRRKFSREEMVVFGFFFDRGSFNARTTGNTSELRAHRVESPSGGVEATLRSVAPRLIVDLRKIVAQPARAYFSQPQRYWMIGALFGGDPAQYRAFSSLTESYDVMIWIEESSESVLLPFV